MPGGASTAGGGGKRGQVELHLLLALDLAEAAVLDEADRVRVVGADLRSAGPASRARAPRAETRAAAPRRSRER